jgi:hypothetical protein
MRSATFCGGPFDYISVTPPYEAVKYSELMDLLSKSPLISEDTYMVRDMSHIQHFLDSVPEECTQSSSVDKKYGAVWACRSLVSSKSKLTLYGLLCNADSFFLPCSSLNTQARLRGSCQILAGLFISSGIVAMGVSFFRMNRCHCSSCG